MLATYVNLVSDFSTLFRKQQIFALTVSGLFAAGDTCNRA